MDNRKYSAPVEFGLKSLDPEIRDELQPLVRKSFEAVSELQEMHNLLSYRIGGEVLYEFARYLCSFTRKPGPD